MNEENKEKGIKKNKEKIIIIILSIVIILLLVLSGFAIYRSMNSESKTPTVPTGNTSSIEENTSSTTQKEDTSSTNKEEKNIELELKIENGGVAVYNKNDISLIRRVDYANNYYPVELNGTTFYNVECNPLTEGLLDRNISVLDNNGNVIIDTSSFPVEYNESFKHTYSKRCSPDLYVFSTSYDTKNNLIAGNFYIYEQKNKIYIFDLKGKLINTITNDNIVVLKEDYFITEGDNLVQIIDYNNKIIKMISLEAGEKVWNESLEPWLWWDRNKEYFEIGIINPSADYDYIYRYYPITDELKKIKVDVLHLKSYEVIE